MLKRIARNPLIDLLVHLKGNERACLWTEPLWGIPYNLYVPFVSVYMAALAGPTVTTGKQHSRNKQFSTIRSKTRLRACMTLESGEKTDCIKSLPGSRFLSMAMV